jgi:hypothetical protein
MANKRSSERITFGHDRVVRMIGRDGSWQRACKMEDVSAAGAKLRVEGSLDGLDLKDFFLALSKMGKAHRRCTMVWQAGNQLGVRFIKPTQTATATTSQ